jgi:predicted branched-subunit amino acid permease
MFWKYLRHPEFRRGAKDIASVAFGTAAWGLMAGVASVKSGLSLAETLVLTFTVYAGSAQLAAVPLIVAGAPMWVIWATAICVNLRFVVFSAHLRQYLMHLPRVQRLFVGYLCTDSSYAMFTKRFVHPARDAKGRETEQAYLYGLVCINWLNWMGASLIGILMAHRLPPHWGLQFAGILTLLGIACALITSRLHAVSAVSAVIVALLCMSLPLKLNIVAAIVVAVLICAWLEKPLGRN